MEDARRIEKYQEFLVNKSRMLVSKFQWNIHTGIYDTQMVLDNTEELNAAILLQGKLKKYGLEETPSFKALSFMIRELYLIQ